MLIKKEFKYYFPSLLALVGYVVGIGINLIIYKLTSKAFLPNMKIPNEYLNRGYFEFIVLGELGLYLPMLNLVEAQELFFREKSQGILEQVLFTKKSIITYLMSVFFNVVVVKSLFVFFSLAIGILFLGMSIPVLNLIEFIFFQFLSVVLFLPFFVFVLLGTFVIKKRSTSFLHVVNLLGFFSGAYFPIEMFQSYPGLKFLLISPFTALTKINREIINGSNNGVGTSFMVLLYWFLFMTFLNLIIKIILDKKIKGKAYVMP